jgi:hypothetical protein
MGLRLERELRAGTLLKISAFSVLPNSMLSSRKKPGKIYQELISNDVHGFCTGMLHGN